MAGPDPAVAPLGTDDEAAGHSPDGERTAMARRDELRSPPGDASPDRVTNRVWWSLIAVAVACAVAILVAVLAGR